MLEKTPSNGSGSPDSPVPAGPVALTLFGETPAPASRPANRADGDADSRTSNPPNPARNNVAGFDGVRKSVARYEYPHTDADGFDYASHLPDHLGVIDITTP